MKSFALNLFVAVIWLLLGQELSLVNFIIGFLIGFALLALFRPVLGSHGYVRRTTAAFLYLFIFGKQFLLSCWNIFHAALLVPVDQLNPRLITYDVEGLSRLEILLLSHSISLTPGTTTVEISEDFSTFLIHVFNTGSPDEVRDEITTTLRRGILAFTR